MSNGVGKSKRWIMKFGNSSPGPFDQSRVVKILARLPFFSYPSSLSFLIYDHLLNVKKVSCDFYRGDFNRTFSDVLFTFSSVSLFFTLICFFALLATYLLNKRFRKAIFLSVKGVVLAGIWIFVSLFTFHLFNHCSFKNLQFDLFPH